MIKPGFYYDISITHAQEDSSDTSISTRRTKASVL